MKTINIFLSVLISIFIFGCEEVITLDNEQSKPKMVVEGLVINKKKRHYVQLSLSQGFYDTDNKSYINDANVKVIEILDNEETVYQYTYFPEENAYFSNRSYMGKFGATYKLMIEHEGNTYFSENKLNQINEIEKLTWKFDQRRYDQRNLLPEDQKGYYYQILLTTTEPEETKDYYQFRFYRNDTIINNNGNNVYVIDDQIISGKLTDFPSPVYYKLDDLARLQISSLTPESYKYYNDLSKVLNNDGGLFSSVPANPASNISGGALGLFQASGVVEEEIIIGDEKYESK
ncbi:DUF4249 family protein [Aureibacter tunicatorum]|uniref:DUF4249 domain-containing protein n=1 Tax=Aureibacter tunicatorum TaxID=866807 RepID=A0AAE3XNN1_9BACT|nr:DUF4249 family protein [Aureibacter tunicatorum]MDR6239797.1 hypothetical protein [Aureibacter tunicatorum]BDD04272.1 hypothetical protein AUTU_17550 [Aureibacter tunicatorum]